LNVKVLEKDIVPGMFVAELDRPWLDTPFLLQGFVVESQEDIEQLRRLCKFVYVDPERSNVDAVANLIIPKAAAEPVSPRPKVQVTVAIEQPAQSVATQKSRPSLLKDIKQIMTETAAPREQSDTAASRGSAPVITYSAGQEPAKKWARAKATDVPPSAAETAGPRTTPGVKNADAPVFINTDKSAATAQKSGFMKQIFGILRSKSEEPVEEYSQEGEERIEIAYNRPLIRVWENKIVHEEELIEAKEIHQRSRDLIHGIMEDIRRERDLNVDKANEIIDDMVNSVGRNPDALLWLTKLKTQDSYSYDHGIDVAIYMLAFGRHLGYPKETLHVLGMSGLMQDIGKLKVRAELLAKSAKLTAAEFEEVKYHVNHSLDILRRTADIPGDVVKVVAQHHERFDGSGYPRGLRGDEIHTFASMSGIVDCFEALVSERPYAGAVSTHQALQQLNRYKGVSFHEALTEQFIQCIGIFPVGSLVELNTAEVGVVVAQNKIRRLKPKVMLLLGADKQPFKFPVMLDLINDPVGPGNVTYQIKRDLPSGSHGIDPREYYL
jgi:HD-GYP domain-containing protein (c-di-GMP phosphodiesterase class II)